MFVTMLQENYKLLSIQKQYKKNSLNIAYCLFAFSIYKKVYGFLVTLLQNRLFVTKIS